MRRWIFLIVIALFFFANRKEPNQTEQVQTQQKLDEKVKPVSHYVPKKYPPIQPKKRTPAARPTIKRKIDRSLSSLRKENSIKIGTSFEVIENLSAIKKTDYRPEMGKKISENQHLIFFHPASQNPQALPVAMHVSSQRLFPVSHVLHVKGIDTHQRDQLKAEGMKEFYYHPRMKLLSLETSPSTVLSQYQILLQRGFDVRLEVLKDMPKSK